ncbi:hypothetical protein [Leucobacter chromiiresistens]|uniref:hypothetical protein n=1 Tax=Leucobacter chromiiresistens TaxID=1079994 RepID=UPI00128F9F05|nr:hypothetical protein [Leucobacter chromiiresistens]
MTLPQVHDPHSTDAVAPAGDASTPAAHCFAVHEWLPMASQLRPRLEVPRIHEWPPAVRSAERLRGTLVPCGPGMRPVAWPETPRVRLSALAPWLQERYVAIGLTAAWVWGAARSPGDPLQCSTIGRKRPPARRAPGVDVHEHALAAADFVLIGREAATTPTRTLCDLLRSPGPFDVEPRVACRVLLARHPGGRSAVQTALDAGSSRHRRIATARLASL